MEEIKESGFRIKIPKLKKLEYEFNESYEKKGSIKLNIQTETKILMKKSDAVVSLELQVFNRSAFDNGKIPFYIQVIMVSDFEWSDDIEEKTVRSLLENNAPAALLSYMRPYISGITSGSGYPPLIIPLLNFKTNEVIYI